MFGEWRTTGALDFGHLETTCASTATAAVKAGSSVLCAKVTTGARWTSTALELAAQPGRHLAVIAK